MACLFEVFGRYFLYSLCLFFFGKKSGHADDKLTKLFKEPLTYWTSASSRLKDHEANSKVHKDTALLTQLFKQRMKRDIVSVDELANSVQKQRIESNRMKLKSILKTVFSVDSKTLHCEATGMIPGTLTLH